MPITPATADKLLDVLCEVLDEHKDCKGCVSCGKALTLIEQAKREQSGGRARPYFGKSPCPLCNELVTNNALGPRQLLVWHTHLRACRKNRGMR